MDQYTEADLHVKNSLRIGNSQAIQDKVKEAMPKIKAEIDNIYGGLQYINTKANGEAITTHNHSSSEESAVKKVSNELTTPDGNSRLRVYGREIITDNNLVAQMSNNDFASKKWRRTVDGFTIQWGVIDTGSEGSYHVVFPKPFKKVFNIKMTKDDTGADARWDTWPEKRNLIADTDGLFKGFDVWINWSGSTNNSGSVDWIAFGYTDLDNFHVIL